MIPLAHGVGSRADLPVPSSYAVIGGGVVLVASFAALGLLWRSPRLRGDAGGRPLPDGLARLLDSPVLRGVLRALVLAVSLLVLVIAWVGPSSVAFNVAPWVLYVTFWVGLVPLSLLLGPVWAVVNPLRTLHAGLRRVTGEPRAPGLADRLGYAPAAVSLLLFAWLELAVPERSDPRRVALFLTAYAVVHLVAACLVGERWFARGEGFEVWSRLLGRFAVLGRRDDGRLVLRNPLDGADGTPVARGLWAVVVVLVGSTAFDGVTRTTAWQGSRFAAEDSWTGPLLGLLVTVALVGVLYLVGAAVAGRVAGVPGAADVFAHSLVPIAAGYAVAHYFSLFLLDGQTTFLLASDPFHNGADLFGTAGGAVDYTLVSARTISVVQVVAIVLGHVVGLLLAHDRSLVLAATGRPHRPWVAQLPLLVVMVALTTGGLALLLGT